jgi:hypothetical protein
MFLPLGLGVACASAGFSTVQAGGPPSAPEHVWKPRHVPREKPILHNPRWRTNIDVFVHNLNHNRNHNSERHRFDRRDEDIRRDDIRREPVKDENDDHGKWWWPDAAN